MEIEYIDIAKIKEYENNAKEHPQEQVQQIADSIEEFGFNDPVAIDEDNIIIEGHGRYLASKILGLKSIPIIRLKHLSETQKRAYILAHNKLTLNTGFDKETLIKELTSLFESGFDLLITGFDENEIEEFGIGFNVKDIDYDKANDVPKVEDDKVVIKKGDLIELGEHKLLCGDATDRADVLKLLDPILKTKITKHFISDPPYGISYDPKLEKYGMIKNDDKFLNFIPLAKKYTNGFFMIWTSYQVVDFFLGSGSNMIACENLERVCYGMELDTKYAQIIVERYTEYTSIDQLIINSKKVSWNEYKKLR